MTHIRLIRHGTTEGNHTHAYIGRTDEPLMNEGRQSLLGFPYLPCERVYVTPLIRTVQTASILFPHAEQVTVPDLREMDFGIMEGVTEEELSDNTFYLDWINSGGLLPIPGGTDPLDFQKRVSSAFINVLQNDPSPVVTFVIHGAVIMALMATFSGTGTNNLFRWFPKNGEGYEADFDGKQFLYIHPLTLPSR